MAGFYQQQNRFPKQQGFYVQTPVPQPVVFNQPGYWNANLPVMQPVWPQQDQFFYNTQRPAMVQVVPVQDSYRPGYVHSNVGFVPQQPTVQLLRPVVPANHFYLQHQPPAQIPVQEVYVNTPVKIPASFIPQQASVQVLRPLVGSPEVFTPVEKNLPPVPPMPAIPKSFKPGNKFQVTVNTNSNVDLASEILSTPDITGSRVKKYPFKNDLKELFNKNGAVIEAVVIRTLGAEDKNHNGVIEPEQGENGTFLKAVNRLDELKAKGINCLHVLPISEPGKTNKLGNAASVYAPEDFNKLATELDTPNNGLTVKDEMKIFINECHKRGIRVMVDLPSCGSIDMADKYPEWFVRYKFGPQKGKMKVPGTWRDIRMLDPYKNSDTGELRRALVDMHKEFVKNMVDVGADGIRADVARAKPINFWEEVISYSRELDPNFGWLAETYVREDASPMANIPADRPEELLRSGYDLYYGQYHILQWMKSATEVNKYVVDNIKMSHRLPPGKGLIGSFYTHDDLSVMGHGDALYCRYAASLLSFLPMVNPYYIVGFDRGDTKQLDIFNYTTAPTGKAPQLYEFSKELNKARKDHERIVGLGYYTPLKVTSGSDKSDKIIAFLRHLDGKTLLVLANQDMNSRHSGKISLPTLNPNQKLLDIVPSYGASSKISPLKDGLVVNLAPGRVHVFEIDTPDIGIVMEKQSYRQNVAPSLD